MDDMYEKYKVYGPYKNRDDRDFVVLVYDNEKISISYPKFLYEKYYNIKLKNNETIHHIDGDYNNNNIENLKRINRSDHVKLHAEENKRADITVKCVWCGKSFTIKGNKIYHRERGKAGPFCSPKCSGEFGAEVQNKRINPEDYKNNIML